MRGPILQPEPRTQRGFTLIELMIVVAIIAIVAAIALPSLANARKSANEASAIGSLRSLTTVMEQYRTRFGRYPSAWSHIRDTGYLAGFDGAVGAGLGGAPNVGGKSGYSFVISALTGIPWRVFAIPNQVGETGDRYFYVDSSGVIRFSLTGIAGHTSPPL